MAQKKKRETRRPIESYDHRDKEHINNPPVGLVTPETDPDAGQKKRCAYDPQPVWTGKVQMIYIDPPYGIKYGSNFQPIVNRRDVRDGNDEDLTAEPEQIKAFRDTWELGIHSYLTYLRDRLLLARELLTESGSIFVQISDENVHILADLSFDMTELGAEGLCEDKHWKFGVLPCATLTLVWFSTSSSNIWRPRAMLTVPSRMGGFVIA